METPINELMTWILNETLEKETYPHGFDIVQKAIELLDYEKHSIITAYEVGTIDSDHSWRTGEEYFNQTFNKEHGRISENLK